jgi:hypothetical protein
MKYIKYFEGFDRQQIDYFINTGETSVRKIDREFNNNSNLLADEIKDYDISLFTYNYKHGQFKIYPEEGFMDLYKRYCDVNNFTVKDLTFSISVLPYNIFTNIYNQIDSEYILPDNNLKGLSLGYKLYKYVLNIVDFIMTDRNNLPEAKNLWWNLLQDKDVYSGTNKELSILIKKDIGDDKLKEIIDKVDRVNLTYDDDLNIKIKRLYGSN